MSFFKDGLTGLSDGLGLTDSGAGGRAYAAQAAAMAEANRIQEKNYAEAKERYRPYQEAGEKGFSRLADLTNNYKNFNESDGHFQGHSGVFGEEDFKKDPGYQFRMDEGTKAINRRAAAGGSLGGGATMKALARYGQGVASEEYGKAYNRFNQDYGNSYNRFNQDQGNRFSRFGNLANYGQNANNALTGIGNNYANQMSGNALSLGNSQASMEMNKGNSMKELWGMGMQGAGMAMGMPSGGGMGKPKAPKSEQNFAYNFKPQSGSAYA